MGKYNFVNVFSGVESQYLRNKIKRLEINPGVQQTYSAIYWLSKKKGFAFAKQETLAHLLNLHTSTVKRHIKRLKDLGFLDVIRQGCKVAKYFVQDVKAVLAKLPDKKKVHKNLNMRLQKDSPNYSIYNKGLPLTPSPKRDEFSVLCEKYPNKNNLHKASRPFNRLKRSGELPTLIEFSKLVEKAKLLSPWKRGAVPELWRWLRYGWFRTVDHDLAEEQIRIKKLKEQHHQEKAEEQATALEITEFDSWYSSLSPSSLESLKVKKATEVHKHIPFELWLRLKYFPELTQNEKRRNSSGTRQSSRDHTVKGRSCMAAGNDQQPNFQEPTATITTPGREVSFCFGGANQSA